MKEKYESLKKYRNVFNVLVISTEGFPKEDNINVRLLSDDDIIVFLKNECHNEISEQYFSRDKSYKPLWKSEPEFVEVVKKELRARILRELRSELQIFTSANGKDISFINEQVYTDALDQIKKVVKKIIDDPKRIDVEKIH